MTIETSKPIVAIGWDVGGWIGNKQGVAAVKAGPIGVEWLGTARRFRLADFASSDWSLLDLMRVAWPDASDHTLETHRVILAIDSPLGFPRAFTQLLNTGEALGFPPKGREIDNPLAYRDCDRHVYEVLKKKPLSASFDKLGNNATVAMYHARRLARLHGAQVLPFDTSDDAAHTIIEVYPALLKKPKDACCYEAVQAILPSTSGHEPIRDSLRRSLSSTDDVKCTQRMDADVPADAQNAPTGTWKTAQTAVSHRAHTHHHLTSSTHEIPDTPAKLEGWIYYVDLPALSGSTLAD